MNRVIIITRWCNGSTVDFDSASLGSSPSRVVLNIGRWCNGSIKVSKTFGQSSNLWRPVWGDSVAAARQYPSGQTLKSVSVGSNPTPPVITQVKLIRESTRFLPWGLGEFESPHLYLNSPRCYLAAWPVWSRAVSVQIWAGRWVLIIIKDLNLCCRI